MSATPSMRMLLGYDPKDTKKRSSFGSTASLRSDNATMNTKPKYHVPMSRVKKLPPISEEGGTPFTTPRAQVRPNPSPRGKFVSKTLPPNQKPTIYVRPLPQEVPQHESPARKEKPVPVFDPMKPLTPLNVDHSVVDGLVADYLHYARYGHIIPVYEGTSTDACPCCTDRNRQNVRTLLGFKGNVKEAPKPKKYDKLSALSQPESEPELSSSGKLYPNSMYAKLTAPKKEPSPREKALHRLAEYSQQKSWMAYQPLPYATNYLNPEFNRPAEISRFNAYQQLPSEKYIAGAVVDANSRYDSAMDRLGQFGSGSYGT